MLSRWSSSNINIESSLVCSTNVLNHSHSLEGVEDDRRAFVLDPLIADPPSL